MSGLFSQNNLPLCGMQGSNALLGKNQNQYTASRFSLSTSANFVVREIRFKNLLRLFFNLWFCKASV